MNQTDAPAPRKFWNLADTKKAGHIVVGGLFVGVIVRWLVISTPTMAVTARGASESIEPAPITNSVAAPKIEDASPSAPD
ncbi:MAG TPA: hypothetical protein VFZ59_25145 [Verrucomicrobiae bacterium]|nr:hypothetical protein [Verrucomicrobiae bacterium]